ncbi:helix-turn-helix domain-containing protein [Streptomyces sp. NPDC050658]|uniref:helix-turn-helix domain-containing protein n=1 Tax=unclassified Streptomyces TaxID=2593676 RepID=UPI00341F448C
MSYEKVVYAERASLVPGAVLWTRATTGGGPGPVRPVLPDGCMDLLWSGGRLMVAGPDTRAYRPAPDLAAARFVGIRFYPGTAPAFLGVPAHELRDRRVDLADLWPSAETRRLTERMAEAPDPVAALESLALERADRAEPPDPLLAHIVKSLDAGRSIAATAAEAGVNTRLLHRRSLAAFGYGPKTLGRVLRLQRALALAADGMPYAATAAVAGFADQAHLARDVKELTGMALGELLRGH